MRGYIISEVNYEYNDETYDPTGKVAQVVFLDKNRAIAEAKKMARFRLGNRGEVQYYNAGWDEYMIPDSFFEDDDNDRYNFNFANLSQERQDELLELIWDKLYCVDEAEVQE